MRDWRAEEVSETIDWRRKKGEEKGFREIKGRKNG